MTNRQQRILECAEYYTNQGWYVIPLYSIVNGKCTCGNTGCKSPGKHPHGKLVKHGPKDATTDKDTIAKWFNNGMPLNIGVCAGEKSGLVVLDVDPAHGGNESLEQYKIPETTEVITGSGGRHFYFKHPGGDVRNSAGTLGDGLDVRGHHGYVVAPPSMHISGQEYRWSVDPKARMPALCPDWIIKENKKITPISPGDSIPEGKRNNTLLSMAGAMRCKGFENEEIYEALRSVNQRRCKPPLSNDEIKKLAKCVGKYNPQPQKDVIMLENSHPDTIAEAFEQWSQVSHRHHIDIWTVIKDCRYQKVDESEIRKWIRKFLPKVRIPYKKGVLRPKATPSLISSILEALSALDQVWIRPRCMPPTWLGPSKLKPENIIAMNNGLLDITEDIPQLQPLSEEFYTLNYLPFDYDPQAECPRWEKFLIEIFQIKQLNSQETKWSPEERDFIEEYECIPDFKSIELLQDYMGYLLSQDTRHQKILGIIGIKRSGKTTIGRVIWQLIGENNACAPTLSSLATLFGLEGLLHKTVAIIGDANISFHRSDVTQAVEKLKDISGEGSQRIHRKNKLPLDVKKLPIRFVILANELQNLTDPSGALASRWLYLRTTQSFYGREDTFLFDKLMKELPGIFLWALKGLQRLRERGYFAESDAGKELRDEFLELSSPITAFVRDWCELDNDAEITTDDMYKAYQSWCDQNGRKAPSAQRFKNEFKAAFPEINKVRKRSETWDSKPGTGNRRYVYSGIKVVEDWQNEPKS